LLRFSNLVTPKFILSVCPSKNTESMNQEGLAEFGQIDVLDFQRLLQRRQGMMAG